MTLTLPPSVSLSLSLCLQVHEAEYQWAEAKGRAADCKDRVESETHKRDQLEDLVLKLKLYILGGASSVGTMRAPAGKTDTSSPPAARKIGSSLH